MTNRSVFLIIRSLICLVALPDARVLAAVGDHPPPEYCEAKHCYHLDPLGGWGLKPNRTYSLAYNGDKVCKPILDALNGALKTNPKKALASVTFPMPAHPELHLKPEQIGPIGANQNYQSQSALFSDTMFLRWQPLGGIVPYGFTFEAKDWTDRWLIVDLENNGHRYLVKDDGEVMDVPETQLKKHDWTLSDEWQPYRELWTPWPDAPAQAVGTNPIDRWRNLTWSIPGQGRDDTFKGWPYPKLGSSSQPIWRYFARIQARPQFVNMNELIYTVLYDPVYDLMIVDNLGYELGDDLCYIQSDIDRSQVFPIGHH